MLAGGVAQGVRASGRQAVGRRGSNAGDLVYKGEPGPAPPRGVCDLPTEWVPPNEPQFS